MFENLNKQKFLIYTDKDVCISERALKLLNSKLLKNITVIDNIDAMKAPSSCLENLFRTDSKTEVSFLKIEDKKIISIFRQRNH